MIRKAPIRKSGNRHNLFLGGDRELVLVSGIMASILIALGQQIISIMFGILLWIFTLMVTRLMAKSDPKMKDVYLRHIRYKKYYSARSKAFFINKKQWKDV